MAITGSAMTSRSPGRDRVGARLPASCRRGERGEPEPARPAQVAAGSVGPRRSHRSTAAPRTFAPTGSRWLTKRARRASCAFGVSGDRGGAGAWRISPSTTMDGSIDWLCLPHFDSPSVFAAILDDREGRPLPHRPAGDHGRLQAVLLAGHQRPHHPVPPRRRRRRGRGLHAGRRAGGGTEARQLDPAGPVVRGRSALPPGVPARLRLRPRRTRPSSSTRGAASTGRALSLGLATPSRCRRRRAASPPTSPSARAKRPRSSCARARRSTRHRPLPRRGEAEELFRDTVAYWRAGSRLHLHRPLARDGPPLGARRSSS